IGRIPGLTLLACFFHRTLRRRSEILAVARPNVFRHLRTVVGRYAGVTIRLSTAHGRHAVNFVLSSFVYAQSHSAASAPRFLDRLRHRHDSLRVHDSSSHLSLFHALLQKSEAQLLLSLSFAHSLCKTAGCHCGRKSNSSSLTSTARLTPVESALTDDLRVLPGFGRTTSSTSHLESALTDSLPITPLESALTKKSEVEDLLTGHPATITEIGLASLTCPTSAARLATPAPIP